MGAHLDDVGANADQGSAYAYTRSGTVWTQQAKQTAGDGATSDQFGRTVALSGSFGLVGAVGVDAPAPFGSPDEGAAYVYTGVGQQDTTTTLTSALPDASLPGQAVTMEVAVSGATSAPVDGAVTVMASTGESCTDATFTAGGGTTVLFSCAITFNTIGPRTLTASFGGSVIHANSRSVAEPHEVVAPPSLSIGDLSQAEGTGGSTTLQFTVTRSHNLNAVSVQVDTAAATATAGSDYTAIVAQTLNFTAGGADTAMVSVTVAADAVVEGNENLFVQLSNAIGATIGDSQAVGTIENDDSASIAINDLSQAEGNAGTTAFNFTVTLSAAVQGGVSVPFASADGTATAPSDFGSQSGSLNFTGTAGETRTVTIQVVGDTIYEGNESFLVNLTAPANTSITLADGSGLGTITEDDRASLALTATAAPNPASVSQTVTVTVTLDLQPGAPAPTGSIQVSSAAGNHCAIELPALSCSYTPNYLGPQSLSLSFPGDSNVAPANTSTPHSVLRFADLSISKDDGRNVVDAGEVLNYQIVVRNDGPDLASGVQVQDLIPATLGNASWTCTGSACATSSGTGSIQQIISLPAGQQLTYVLTATVVSPTAAFVDNTARLIVSASNPDFVFDPDTADQIAVDVNIIDRAFRNGFETP